jgi:hypothetical protein
MKPLRLPKLTMLRQFEFTAFSCIRKDVESVTSVLFDRFPSIFGGNWEFHIGHQKQADVYQVQPPKGGIRLLKVLAWEPINATGTTVFFPNVEDGLERPIKILCKQFAWEVLSLALTVREASSEPLFRFSYVDVSGQERLLQLLWDSDHWEFVQRGQAFAFEDTTIYERRPTRERLSAELILSYAQHLGWRPGEVAFWDSKLPFRLLEQISRS